MTYSNTEVHFEVRQVFDGSCREFKAEFRTEEQARNFIAAIKEPRGKITLRRMERTETFGIENLKVGIHEHSTDLH